MTPCSFSLTDEIFAIAWFFSSNFHTKCILLFLSHKKLYIVKKGSSGCVQSIIGSRPSQNKKKKGGQNREGEKWYVIARRLMDR